MGSRGGGSYLSSRDLDELKSQSRERLERGQFDAEVNSFLQEQLAGFNDRDVNETSARLEEVEDALGEHIESFDRLLFGGSVAKHTYVDGLSDVDSLVLLKDAELWKKEPAQVRAEFLDALRRDLRQGEIEEIRAGNMAVTISYRDGNEIQLLPAVLSGENVLISSPDGKSWSRVEPRAFARELSRINERQGGSVVPAVKLAKAILESRLGDRAPSGYHVESLAVAAFRDYDGPRTPKAMLGALLSRASNDVLRPIHDVTGQSRHVDEYLGAGGSSAARS